MIAATVVISLLIDRVAWPITWVTATAVFTVIGTELFFYAIPRRLRRAWAGMAIVGNPDMERWLGETGTPVPVTPANMRTQLGRRPGAPSPNRRDCG